MPPFVQGARVHDRFTLVEPIRAGGMSQVWRATDEVLDRPVAVKLLIAGAEPGPLPSTWREARAAAQLAHPNVAQVYDYGEALSPDGTLVPYLVMELVDGVDLATRLAQGPLPWPQAVRVGAQVAAALTAAHRAGVVHRDIKPANIVLTATGAKVLDFGIAALPGAGSERERDWLVGTPTYAAPERLDPDPARPASDVYSLGVLLYESLTGRPPILLPTWADAAAARRSGRTPSGLDLPELPERVASLCLGCLSAAPAARPAAGEVAAGLAAIAGLPTPAATLAAGHGAPTLVTPRAFAVGAAPRPHPATLLERRPRRRAGLPRRAATAASAALAVALALAWLWPGVPGWLVDDRNAVGPDASVVAPHARPGSTPYETVIMLDRAITEGLASGAISTDSARDLRDRLDDLRRQLGHDDGEQRAEKLHEKADALRTEIINRRDEGTINRAVADQLALQLDTLREGG